MTTPEGKAEWAEWWIEHGFKVLPLNGKVPVCAGGYKAATDDLAEVAIWNDQPTLNIGIVAPANVIAVDIDPKNGASKSALAAEIGVALPDTFTVNTSRGPESVHLFYRVPSTESLRGQAMVGVDIKHAGNGYTVAAGSIHPDTGKPYRVTADLPIADAPEELVRLIAKPRRWNPSYRGKRSVALAADTSANVGNGVQTPGRAWAHRVLSDCVAELATAPEGARNSTMNRVAFHLGTLAGAGQLDTEKVIEDLTVAAETCGLDRTEIATTITRAVRDGMTEPWEGGSGGETDASQVDSEGPNSLGLDVVKVEPDPCQKLNGDAKFPYRAISYPINETTSGIRSLYGAFADLMGSPAHRWQANALDVKKGTRDQLARQLAISLAGLVTVTDGEDPLSEPISITMGSLLKAMELDPKSATDREALKKTALPSLERSGLIRRENKGKGRGAYMLIWLVRTAPDRIERADAPEQGFTRTAEQEALFQRVLEFVGGSDSADRLASLEHFGLQQPGPAELVIQGPAGSGKTTVAAQALLAAGVPYVSSAYTNRAVDVQRQKGLHGRTIHSLALGLTSDSGWQIVHNKTAEARSNYAVVLVDESSMLDEFHYEAIRQAANKVIFVGDPGQLDPVGGDAFWNGRDPDVRLTESMRFSDGSEIGRLAKQLWCTDYNPEVLESSNAWIDGPIDWSEWDTAICYRNSTRWLANLGFMGGTWREPQAGDPVMVRYNVPVEDVFNRQLFTVVANRGRATIKGVEMYDLTLADAAGRCFDKHLLADGFNNAEGEASAIATKGVSLGGSRWAIPATYGFAHTAHSAQGGEWARVLVVDESFGIASSSDDPLAANRYLYTAITRARKSLGLTSIAALA